MLRRAISVVVQAVLGLGVEACHSSGDVEPTTVQRCVGPVTVNVMAGGDKPEFGWTPACALSRLAVFSIPGHDAEDLGVSQWRVNSSGLLVPPIEYGVLPPDGSEIPAAPLVVGNAYLIVVDRDSSGVVVSQGTGSFVR